MLSVHYENIDIAYDNIACKYFAVFAVVAAVDYT